MSRKPYILRMTDSPASASGVARARIVDAAAPVVSTPWPRLALAMGLRPALLIAIGAALVAAGRSLL